MKKFLIIFLLVASVSHPDYRKPQFAGSFYPSDKTILKQTLDEFFKNVNYKEKMEREKIIGVISPHAGYIYSGQVSAYSFKLLENSNINNVILIGRSHYSYFKGAIIDNRDGWETPLGKVEIDKDIFEKLYKNKNFFVNKVLLDYEHSLEVQIPFLQYILKDFKIFPILLGDISEENIKEISNALFEVLKNKKNYIIVASTDLSHYYPYEIARKKDILLLETLKTKDINLLNLRLSKKEVEMCGDCAVLTLLKIAEKYDYEIKILYYANSGDTSGDKSKVVGYGSVAIFKTEKKGGNMLTEQQKKILLKIARETIEYYLKGEKLPELKIDDPVLKEKRGVFVTLHKKGNLRGCIGYIEPIKPLYLAVREMAIHSATEDPRFEPVSYNELKDIEIEISVLTVPQKVKSPDEIVLGRDGVIVKRGFNQGVFLPQVAQETGWTKEEFLSYLCSHKASLPPDAWKDPKTELYIFQAEVFSEKDFK